MSEKDLSEMTVDELLKRFKEDLKYDQRHKPDLTGRNKEDINPGGMTNHYAIAILESGIFRDCKLKGRPIGGKFRLYPIESPFQFVIESGMIFSIWIRTRDQQQMFADASYGLLEHFDDVSREVLKYRGVRPEKVKAIRQKLVAMREKTISKLSRIKGPTYDLVSALIPKFKQYMPTAPNQTIAARIQDLLKIVDLHVEQETIRKRIQNFHAPTA
jgi:hypothetical protein